MLIGVARKLPQSESDQYRFWEFAKSTSPRESLLRLPDHPSEGLTTYADKIQKNTRPLVGEPTFQLENKRPEAIAQRRMHEMASYSPRAMQLKDFDDMANNSAQAEHTDPLESMTYNHATKQGPIQSNQNDAELPDKLRAGIERLSNHWMGDVKVHLNSPKPAQFNANAYTQGTDIHIAPGQEKYLPHEAWHVA